MSSRILACVTCLFFFLCLASAPCAGQTQENQRVEDLFQKFQWRSIGPANMGAAGCGSP